MMQGLELSRRYFEACLPLLQEQAGDILPLCAVSAAVYLLGQSFDLMGALPYLIGGLAGGLVGGGLFRCVSVEWLRGLFAVFLLYGGVRYLL